MRVLNALLTHQPAEKVDRMVSYWTQSLPASDVFIVHGGLREEFEQIRHPHKAFVEEARLRTKHHRTERQSYTEVFRHIAAAAGEFSHVLFAEFDLVPLAPITVVHEAYFSQLQKEKADAVFRLLYEVQDTCQEVAITYRDDGEFWSFWKSVSKRQDFKTVFWALLPGSFWKVEALQAVAAIEESHPIYFEIYLPTLAHHLGFRLRTLSDDRFAIFGGKPLDPELGRLSAAGVLVAHPVKTCWD